MIGRLLLGERTKGRESDEMVTCPYHEEVISPKNQLREGFVSPTVILHLEADVEHELASPSGCPCDHH